MLMPPVLEHLHVYSFPFSMPSLIGKSSGIHCLEVALHLATLHACGVEPVPQWPIKDKAAHDSDGY